jgi:hypothetical protein
MLGVGVVREFVLMSWRLFECDPSSSTTTSPIGFVSDPLWLFWKGIRLIAVPPGNFNDPAITLLVGSFEVPPSSNSNFDWALLCSSMLAKQCYSPVGLLQHVTRGLLSIFFDSKLFCSVELAFKPVGFKR